MDLLTFVARHIAAALERTRLIDETRQRSAELALVNDVQRGLAEKLDMQAMYDLVGDQHPGDLRRPGRGHRHRRHRRRACIRFPYTIERGVRFPDEPIEISRAPSSIVLETREPVGRERRASSGRSTEAGQAVRARTASRPKSSMFVPLARRWPGDRA